MAIWSMCKSVEMSFDGHRSVHLIETSYVLKLHMQLQCDVYIIWEERETLKDKDENPCDGFAKRYCDVFGSKLGFMCLPNLPK